MSPLNPHANQRGVDDAAIRFQGVKEAATKEARSLGMTEEQADDYGQVAAGLDKEARHGTLRILRCTTDGGRIARHKVFLLQENSEECSIEFGGHASMAELKRDRHERYWSWLYNKDEIVDGYFRIKVMITDVFPDHEIFKRADGSQIDMGFSDNEHFYTFTVDILKKDLCDTF